MLREIDSTTVEDARRILTLLCFVSRPLTVPELIDGIAVELWPTPLLNRRRRLQDTDDFRSICAGLIEIGVGGGLKAEEEGNRVTPTTVCASLTIRSRNI